MKLAVVGSRSGISQTTVSSQLDKLKDELNITEIISGGAYGVDTMAETWAMRNDIALTVFPAKWELYGKSAGYKRNVLIVDACDKLVAFWDGKSKGTLHSINIAKKQNKLYEIYRS